MGCDCIEEDTKSPACRQEDETKDECIDRKIPELKEENPDWDDDQVYAVAEEMCSESCSDKEKNRMAARRTRANTITKHIGIPLNVEKGIEELENGQIIVNGYFTSDEKDEIGDVITREATENAIPKYREWGNIRYMHKPEPVAKVLKIGKDDGLEWNEVQIQIVDPKAIFQVRNGLLRALSVGIIIWNFEDIEILEDGTWVIHNYDLVEISLVDHPANYDAKLFLDEDKAVSITNDIREMAATQGLSVVAKVLGAPVELENLEEESEMAHIDNDTTSEVEIVDPEIEEFEEEEITANLEVEDQEIEEELSLEDEEIEEEVLDDVDVEVEEELDEIDDLFDDSLELDEDVVDMETEEEEELSVDSDEELDIVEPETIEEGAAEMQIVALSPETIQELASLVVRGLAEVLSQETSEEAPEEEEAEVETDTDVDEPSQETEELSLSEAQEKIASLEAQVADLSTPHDRKGKLPSTEGELPHEVEIEEETEPEGNLLKKSLRRYFSQEPVVQIRPRSENRARN